MIYHGEYRTIPKMNKNRIIGKKVRHILIYNCVFDINQYIQNFHSFFYIILHIKYMETDPSTNIRINSKLQIISD